MPASFEIIQYTSGLQFTENVGDIILKRKQDDAVMVRMSVIFRGVSHCEYIELYYDKMGYIRIKVRDVAKGLIRYNIPENLEIENFPSLTIILMDEAASQQSVKIQLVEGGILQGKEPGSGWWQRNWLTWQPQIVVMPQWQPQWLTIAKPDYGPAAIRIKSRLYTSQGKVLTTDICTVTEQGLMRLDVSYRQLWRQIDDISLTPIAYDVFGIGLNGPDAPDEEGVVNSPFAQRYVLRPKQLFDRCFLYQNSLGGFDSVIATGVSTYLPTGDANTFVNDGQESELDGAYSSVWEQNTGYISSERLARQWREFLNSTNRYFYDPEDNFWRKIIIDEYEVKAKVSTLGAYTFKYHLSRQDEGAIYMREELQAHLLPTKYFDR